MSALADSRTRTPLLAAALSALLGLCALLAGGPTEILGVLPAILLLVALACGRYPGEEVIKRRYRVVRIGVNSLVVEDIEFKSEQTLPLQET